VAVVRDGRIELRDICDQLDRYGTAHMPDEFLDLLWAITGINDDLAHARWQFVIEDISVARAHLIALEEEARKMR
jgi:hypothetical protein